MSSLALPQNSPPAVEVINKIGKTYSYVDAIDALVVNAMSDFVLDDYLDDYDNIMLEEVLQKISCRQSYHL